MMQRIIFLIFVSGLLLACQTDSGEAAYGPEPSMEEAYDAKGAADMAYSEELRREQPSGSSVSEAPPATERKVIRTADLEVEVEQFAEGRELVAALIDRFGAEVASEEEHRYAYRIQTYLTIRLAPEKLDAFIQEVEAIAFHVAGKSVRAEDVTRQYIDLETRLSAKRATLERYREILRSARTVEDVLAVEEQMRQIIEEIESTEQQLRYLRDRVQQSTVNLMLYETFDQLEVRRRNFFQRIGNALVDGWQVFLNILVGLVSAWPVVLILGALGWWLVRRFRKK